MENLNDLIWTDEGNDDGIQPQGIGIAIACMSEYCMGALCGSSINTMSCSVGVAAQGAGCK